MSKYIKVTLLPEWSDYSRENPAGPATFLRQTSEVPGPLQVSLAAYRAGEVPNPSPQDLVSLARKAGDTLGATELVETASGECVFGHFGSTVFRSAESGRMQVWYLSDGYDFIIATHICPEEVDTLVVEQAQKIIKGLIVESRSWWSVWMTRIAIWRAR